MVASARPYLIGVNALAAVSRQMSCVSSEICSLATCGIVDICSARRDKPAEIGNRLQRTMSTAATGS
jgi:hypothetical protein